jgi:hypothetical protein
LNWAHGGFEEIRVQFFKSGSGEGFGEINTVEEVLDFKFGFMSGRKRSLGLFDFSIELLDGFLVSGHIFLISSFKYFHKVIHDSLIEIFSTEMSITSSSDDLENTFIDSEDGDIESTTTKIEDHDVEFDLLVKTVGDSGSSGSLRILTTLRPAIVPASLVACL